MPVAGGRTLPVKMKAYILKNELMFKVILNNCNQKVVNNAQHTLETTQIWSIVMAFKICALKLLG